jgi:hypothetical protein
MRLNPRKRLSIDILQHHLPEDVLYIIFQILAYDLTPSINTPPESVLAFNPFGSNYQLRPHLASGKDFIKSFTSLCLVDRTWRNVAQGFLWRTITISKFSHSNHFKKRLKKLLAILERNPVIGDSVRRARFLIVLEQFKPFFLLKGHSPPSLKRFYDETNLMLAILKRLSRLEELHLLNIPDIMFSPLPKNISLKSFYCDISPKLLNIIPSKLQIVNCERWCIFKHLQAFSTLSTLDLDLVTGLIVHATPKCNFIFPNLTSFSMKCVKFDPSFSAFGDWMIKTSPGLKCLKVVALVYPSFFSVPSNPPPIEKLTVEELFPHRTIKSSDILPFLGALTSISTLSLAEEILEFDSIYKLLPKSIRTIKVLNYTGLYSFEVLPFRTGIIESLVRNKTWERIEFEYGSLRSFWREKEWELWEKVSTEYPTLKIEMNDEEGKIGLHF